VPRRDCSARRGRSCTGNGTGRDHHAARRVAQQQENLAWEGTVEAAPRLDRRANDHQLCAAFGRDARDFRAEAPGPRPDDLRPDRDTVRGGDCGRRLDSLLQAHELPVEVRVDRQLALEDGGRDEHDPGAPVCSEAAGKIDRVLRLLPVEQRHHDAAVGDRARPARESARAAMERSDVGHPHLMSWYGTEARITFGSTSSSRFT
jgi:hypothetical protein